MEFGGGAAASTAGQYPPSVLFLSWVSPEARELSHGRNRYRVTAFGGLPDEAGEPAVVGVNVVAAAEAPEPGTLVLAGLGLATVGLVRARRVRRPASSASAA